MVGHSTKHEVWRTSKLCKKKIPSTSEIITFLGLANNYISDAPVACISFCFGLTSTCSKGLFPVGGVGWVGGLYMVMGVRYWPAGCRRQST